MICPIEWLAVAVERAPKLAFTTDWYDGATRPARIGFYERHFTDSEIIGDWSMHYWDGEVWRSRPGMAPHWRQVGDYPAWRGLTEDQAALNASAAPSTTREKQP